MNVDEYLKENPAKPVTVGRSGAEVYEIKGEKILKHVMRKDLTDEQFATYAREARFYEYMSELDRTYLPKIDELQLTDDEIIILMRRYDPIPRERIGEELIAKTACTLAAIHCEEIPGFVAADIGRSELLLKEQIEESLSGWKSVLDEHPGEFDPSPLDLIADRINDLIIWHETEEMVLVHGDFHFENLLADRKGELIVCDWQGVKLGQPSGDISFFFSRLGADGISVNEEQFLDTYANAVKNINGRVVDTEAVKNHMTAANVITSFVFWHNFLHGNSSERVREIYGKMVDDFKGGAI